MDLVFYCKEKRSDKTAIEWQPGNADLIQWRDNFASLDLKTCLTKVANWTNNNRSRIPLKKNMVRWITNWLREDQGKLDDIGHRHAAFRELSKEPWERQGITEQVWRQHQQSAYERKQNQQAPIPEYRTMSGGDRKLVDDCKRELSEFIESDSKSVKTATKPCQARCTHEGWDMQGLCPHCDIWPHQYQVSMA